MAEGKMQKPIPIPTYEDYAVGAAILAEEFKKEGSAWTAYQKEVVIDIWNKPSIFIFHDAVASVAKLIEPIIDDDHRPADSRYLATHAFKAGMWTGNRLVGNVFDNRLKYDTTHLALCKALPFPENNGQEQYEENGKFLTSIGESGLELAGFECREYITKFSEDIISKERLRRTYCLGVGAIISSADGAYKAVYDDLMMSYEVSQLFNVDELNAYLANAADSGEI